ncbi:MAG: glycosyltransferase family 2 protein [Bdellovibrionia bacterium]
MTIHFVIPTKNEEMTIQSVIQTLGEIARAQEWQYKIFLVDDSNDRTSEIAKSLGATVINGENKGLGYAVLKGLRFALDPTCDRLVSLDSDGQVDLHELVDFVKYSMNNDVDLLLSSRFLNGNHLDYTYPTWSDPRIFGHC